MWLERGDLGKQMSSERWQWWLGMGQRVGQTAQGLTDHCKDTDILSEMGRH